MVLLIIPNICLVLFLFSIVLGEVFFFAHFLCQVQAHTSNRCFDSREMLHSASPSKSRSGRVLISRCIHGAPLMWTPALNFRQIRELLDAQNKRLCIASERRIHESDAATGMMITMSTFTRRVKQTRNSSTYRFVGLRKSFSWNFACLHRCPAGSAPRTATCGSSVAPSDSTRWTASPSSWLGRTPEPSGSSPIHGSPVPNPLWPSRFLSSLRQKSPSPSPKGGKRAYLKKKKKKELQSMNASLIFLTTCWNLTPVFLRVKRNPEQASDGRRRPVTHVTVPVSGSLCLRAS